MATIVLAAAGSAIGSGFGGAVLGLSGAVIGRAVGATVGRMIDQRLLGAGSKVVETGKVQRFSLTGASEGAAVAQVYGRVRIGGQVIWATRFLESTAVSGGGKGMPQPKSVQYSYSVSLAIALCAGEITRVGRVWADGVEIARDQLNMRVYPGSQDQMPDPKIEAVEGVGMAPAYRGVAYVVLESLALGQFGNRVPQLTFEVLRPAQGAVAASLPDLVQGVRGVAMMPGTGEYALATTPVHYNYGPGVNISANVNSPSGKTDFATSLEMLGEELPRCGSVSLVASWFGGDLRCGNCTVQPKVEQNVSDCLGMPWRAGGVDRATAARIAQIDGRVVYGGTPADASVVEAIRAIRAAGQEVMFYPFVLMDQLAGNGLLDPWTGAADQPALPWRGRITLSVAPGQDGSPDRSAVADAEIAAFFGTAQASDFAVSGGAVVYSGPAEWSYRRFILHYAHLAVLAGGVDAFCVGSELRGLTQIRGADDGFPAVAALRALLADVRSIVGADVKLSYASDWSEYGMYQSPEGGLYFPLDALWADDVVDFVGIDNYMPLSDWRDGADHADAGWGSIYNLNYLQANVAGGKDYDWYYTSPEAEAIQLRTPITDGAYDEPWIWRVKDLKSWWSLAHYERPGGIRASVPTAWVPQAKPIRFTEIGCPAIDKGTNEPNKFVDPKSSESSVPRYSRGTRDDLIQLQYLRALLGYWGQAAHNPVSDVYAGAMVDMEHAHVWAWDARPFPYFPNDTSVWADGANYATGHWITGRTSGQPLANVVAEVCEQSGVIAVDVSGLYGYVRGYSLAHVGTAREILQPLMLGYAFDAIEREGTLMFRMRDGTAKAVLTSDGMIDGTGSTGVLQLVRAAEADTTGRVRLNYVEAEGDYVARSAEAVFPDEEVRAVSQSDLPLVLTAAEGRAITERWLAEARVARDVAHFAMPPSGLALGAGDVVTLPDAGGTFRIDRVETAGMQTIEAVRVEPSVYEPSDDVVVSVVPRSFAAPVPTFPVFLDLPLLTGDEVPQAPHLAVTATPWPGTVAVYSAAADSGYRLNLQLSASSVIGVTQTALQAAVSGTWDLGAPVRVKVYGGVLSSAAAGDVLAGANLAVIGDGSSDNWEVFQFANADLVAPDEYDLNLRLRGQAGSDGVMPDVWPTGSLIVLLNGAPQQIDLASSLRGVAQNYRIGSAARSFDDPSYVHLVEAFSGIGLRPYSPCHLVASATDAGDVRVAWVRRTRVDGDSWDGLDVPLGESSEAYQVRVVADSAVVREVTVATPSWTYSAADRLGDGVAAPFRIEVAQISDRFGAGPYTGIDING